MFRLPKYGDGVCLARLAELLDALSIDRARLRQISVVVTGSNGKGSTAAFCANIGRAYGMRTGLFTSPHLYRFNERFQIDGVTIDDHTLARMVSRIEATIAELARNGLHESFGAFEAQFALACLYFQEMQCTFAVFEAGIGGRYDPVRLVGAANTCVTSIDYEHVDLLGHSLELICSDKSDACAAGGNIIYGENCRPLRRHLAEYNRHRAVASLYVRDQIVIDAQFAAAEGQRFDLRYGDDNFASLEIGLLGDVQLNNAAIAAALFINWINGSEGRGERFHGKPSLIETSIRNGLRDTRWPGRLECLQPAPLTIIDVGHTPDGVTRALRSLMDIYGKNGWILVLGISGDKNIDAIATILAPSFDTIICTSAYHKGAAADLIEAAARKANPEATIHISRAIEDAVQLSQRLAHQQSKRVYVAGGLFIAVEYATTLKGESAGDLSFF